MDPANQDINLNSPNKGRGSPDTLSDLPAEGSMSNAINTLPLGLTDEEAEELRTELSKVEEEINTLQQVLFAKERHATELKRKLGLSPLNEFKHNISKGWQDVQTSNAYKKTQETLSVAGQKTTAALSTMGTAISRKLGDMRNSQSFKSFEDKVGNLKYKVIGVRENCDAVTCPTELNSTQDGSPF